MFGGKPNLTKVLRPAALFVGGFIAIHAYSIDGAFAARDGGAGSFSGTPTAAEAFSIDGTEKAVDEKHRRSFQKVFSEDCEQSCVLKFAMISSNRRLLIQNVACEIRTSIKQDGGVAFISNGDESVFDMFVPTLVRSDAEIKVYAFNAMTRFSVPAGNKLYFVIGQALHAACKVNGELAVLK
jgi:hypothetical protein